MSIRIIVAAAAIGALSLPAMAGSWPNIPARKVSSNAAQDCCATKPDRKVAQQEATRAVNGFVYIGGERGWELAQHKFVLQDGRFVHSEECDHAIRTVSGPTPAEVDTVKRFSPG